MKKIFVLLLTACVLFGSVAAFSGCSSKAPSVEEIYDRAVELIEASYAINTVFYGAGMPVYKTDSAYAEFTYLYFGSQYAGEYEIVKDFSAFSSVDAFKAAANKVYSTAYLEDVLYPYAFEGHMIGNGIGGAVMFDARYIEEDGVLYQSTDSGYDLMQNRGRCIYDYSTMTVVSPSNETMCFLEIASWPEGSPDQISVNEVRLVLQDGEWFLDSFTG
ncbi:MAG: hypothetical protein IJF33_03640 [Clostridia bacterium]|nr:hypothetical protein [Clostridia bacterium]